MFDFKNDALKDFADRMLNQQPEDQSENDPFAMIEELASLIEGTIV